LIVITGPGRSGTSFLAGIYKELGFSPGGTWDEANRGGWESPEITHCNQALLRRLGVTAYGPPERYRELSDFVGARLAGAIKGRLTEERRQKVRRAAERLPFRAAAKPTLIPFDLADEIIADEGAELRRLAAAYSVAKDPLFSWTLPIWLATGADVSHVIISTRDVDDALASHDVSEHWQFKSSSDAKNSLLYSLGVTIWSCLDRGVPFTLVRYPDFLDDVRALHGDLVFPDDVSYDKFDEAFRRVYRPALVNAYRRDQDQ
jgi:hypothetical protein